MNDHYYEYCCYQSVNINTQRNNTHNAQIDTSLIRRPTKTPADIERQNETVQIGISRI